MAKYLKILASIGLIIISSNSLANSPSNEAITYDYKLEWQGIDAGTGHGSINNDKNNISINLAIRSTGLAQALLGYYSDTNTIIPKKNNPNLFSSEFHTESHLRSKKRNIDIKYENGKVIEEQVKPADKRSKRPEVHQELKASYNPLNAALLVQKRIKEFQASGKGDHFIISIYDARRTADYNFVIHGRTKKVINNKEVAVIHLNFTRKLKAGYTKREFKNDQTNGPVFDVYFSDDANVKPLKFIGNITYGSITATLL